MTESIAVKNFIDKVKLAQSSKAKDLRLTLEEATDLVNYLALVNSNQLDFDRIVRDLNSLHMKIDRGLSAANYNSGINGGSFKS